MQIKDAIPTIYKKMFVFLKKIFRSKITYGLILLALDVICLIFYVTYSLNIVFVSLSNDGINSRDEYLDMLIASLILIIPTLFIVIDSLFAKSYPSNQFALLRDKPKPARTFTTTVWFCYPFLCNFLYANFIFKSLELIRSDKPSSDESILHSWSILGSMIAIVFPLLIFPLILHLEIYLHRIEFPSKQKITDDYTHIFIKPAFSYVAITTLLGLSLLIQFNNSQSSQFIPLEEIIKIVGMILSWGMLIEFTSNCYQKNIDIKRYNEMKKSPNMTTRRFSIENFGSINELVLTTKDKAE